MALEGFTIGGNTAAPAVVPAASTGSGTALKGFTVGVAPASAKTPAAPASTALVGYKPLLAPGESAFPASAPVSFKAPDTSGLFKNSVSMLDTSMSKIGQTEVSKNIPSLIAAPEKTPTSVGSEFSDYQNPFAGPLSKIGVTVPTSIAQPGSHLESLIQAGKAAGDQLRQSIQKPLSAVANFTIQQAQNWMPKDQAYQNGTRKLNYGDVANILPKMIINSGLPNAILDLAEPIEANTVGQTGGTVTLPSFNNDPIQAQGIETDYEQRIASGQSSSQALWGSALTLGIDLSVLIPLARGIAKVGVANLTPEALLKTTKFNTEDLRTFLQTGDAMPKDLQEAFKTLPDDQKAKLARGLISEIKSPTPSVLGHILDVSDQEAATIFKQLNIPIVSPKPLSLPKGTFDEVLTKEVKNALAKHPEPVVSEALQEQHGITQQYADQVISAVKGDNTLAEAQAKVQAILDAQMPELTGSKGVPVAGVDAKQFGKLSTEKVEALAKIAAIRYQKEVIEPAKKAGGPTILGGDNLKDHFGEDYNDLNHPVYSKAVNDILYPRALKENTNPYVALTGGGPASGKTELLVNDLVNKGFKGVVYDSNLSNYDGAVKQIELARKAGKEVHLYGVLPNVDASRTFSIQRKNKIGRGISDATFARGHAGFPEVAARLLREGILDADHVHILDTRGITDFKQAMFAAATSNYIKDPLAVLNELGYNEEEFKTLYGKENYDATTGQRKEPLQIGSSARDAFAPDRADQGNANDGTNEKRVGQASKRLITSPRGMVAPGQIAEDIAAAAAKIKETFNEIEKARELTGDMTDAIYQHQGKDAAREVRLTKILEDVGTLLEQKGWTELYHYDENKDEELTLEQKEIYTKVIVPLKARLKSVVVELKARGGVIHPELYLLQNDEYTPRNAIDSGSKLDKAIQDVKTAGKKAKAIVTKGGLLSKSAGSVTKKRVYRGLTDEQGNQTLAAIVDGKVLAIQHGKSTNLGQLKFKKNADLLDNEIRPLQRKIDLLQNEVKTLESVKTTNTGIESVLKNIQDKALSLDVPFLDTPDIRDNKAISKDAKRLRGLLHDIRLLSKVKDTEEIILRDQRISTLEKKIVEASNVMAEIESHFNPDNLNGKVFVGNDGKKYTIGQATTKQIEANTKTRYHTNVLANYVVAINQAEHALSSLDLLDYIKGQKDLMIKDDGSSPPDKWLPGATTGLPQFNGYWIEPQAHEALVDLAKRQHGQEPLPRYIGTALGAAFGGAVGGPIGAGIGAIGGTIMGGEAINNLLVKLIVSNPFMHAPNEFAGRGLAAATGSMSANSFKNFKRAYKEVRKNGPLYLSYLEHGAPFMALKGTVKNFSDAVLTQYTGELENDPHALPLALSLGYKTVAGMIKGIDNFNHSMTWGTNDVLFMHALLDYADARNVTPEEAIHQVSKRMADYRIPSRIMGSRSLSKAMQSKYLMFARYHYSGVIKPWTEAAHEGATGTAKEKIDAARAFAYLFLMGLLVYPFLNKMWQGITGSPTSYMTMAGAMRPIQVGEKLAQNGVTGIPAALQSFFTPSPTVSAAIQLGFNVDLFNRNPIYGPLPAEGLSTYGTSLISPLASASRMTPGDFALSLFGVWTPKNVPAKNTLNQMKFDELPALQVQVKKDIVSHNQDKANKEMAEFNTRVIATWNQYQLKISGKQLVTTDDEKQAFLKEWGIKEPGAKALTNAATLYADGSLTSKSSLVDTVVTYAKALGVDPATAFERMFTGQRIVRVSHFGLFSPDSAIIVERMPLADSEAVKKDRGAAEGMVLDHVIPLEAGGSNDKGNLNLIDASQNVGEQHTFENFLGQATKDGMISRAKAREYSIRYKVGQGETLPDAYMKEFADKYNSKPITLQEVESAVNKGQAK